MQKVSNKELAEMAASLVPKVGKEGEDAVGTFATKLSEFHSNNLKDSANLKEAITQAQQLMIEMNTQQLATTPELVRNLSEHLETIYNMSGAGVGTPLATTQRLESILNTAATVTTDTTDNWADGESHELEIRISKAGVASYRLDGRAVSTSPTADVTFDSGDVFTPFMFMLHSSAAACDVILQRLETGLLDDDGNPLDGR